MSNMNDTAFPDLLTDRDGGLSFSGGLTKLEYAAIQIMAGLVSNNNLTGRWDEYAARSVGAARALFAELEKSE